MGRKVQRTATGLEEVGDFDEAPPAPKKQKPKTKTRAKKRPKLTVVK